VFYHEGIYLKVYYACIKREFNCNGKGKSV
jgi:hypothetical protein